LRNAQIQKRHYSGQAKGQSCRLEHRGIIPFYQNKGSQMILKRNYTPQPPPKAPIVHSKPKNEFELKGANRLRKQRLSLFVLSILFIPYVSLVTRISPFDAIDFLLAFICFCYLGYPSFKYAFVKCPRCNNLYGSTKSWASGFTSKYLHCGLSIRKKDLILDFKKQGGRCYERCKQRNY